ncbi:hypothetical protein ABH933_001258 [Nocardia sp. GP40]|uniref:hypothetical protein n=1 Tax=Nocardia sp. GP40 TaxID=3156268 RepID=UPI003D1D0EC7
MVTIEIVPGLVVDETMYEATAAGVAAYVPELGPLSWTQFVNPARWWLNPDQDGNCYKAELSLSANVWVNKWELPDIRGGQKPRPHSHPWRFESRLLTGGYTENRYERTETATSGTPPVRELLGIEHRTGELNTVEGWEYHEIPEVHEPGRTLSLMICGPGVEGAWGYLDVSTGKHTPGAPDPDYEARLRALNPHRY